MAGELTARVERISEPLVGEEQGWCSKGRQRGDQVSALKQVIEKIVEKKEKVYVASVDLEKAYVKVNRKALKEVLTLYSVHGRLVNASKRTLQWS